MQTMMRQKTATQREKPTFKYVENQRGVETADKVIDEINKRNKLLLLADRSEGGWETVREYQVDELAENSVDERRIVQPRHELWLAKKKKDRYKPYERPGTSTITRPATKTDKSGANPVKKDMKPIDFTTIREARRTPSGRKEAKARKSNSVGGVVDADPIEINVGELMRPGESGY